MTPLLAQTGISPLSGHEGWVGAGLLGAVLAWLLFVHLPAKDKQINDHVKSRDELADRLESKYEAALVKVVSTQSDALKEQRARHEAVLKLVIEHCDKESLQISKTMESAMDEISQAVLDLRRAIEEKRTADRNNQPPT